MKESKTVIEKIQFFLINVTCSLISHIDIPTSLYILIMIYENLQFLIYILHYNVPQVDSYYFLIFQNIFDLMSISHLDTEAKFPCIILGVTLFLILSQCILFIYYSDKDRNNPGSKLLKIISLESILLIRIGILPIFNLSSSLLRCKYEIQKLDITICNSLETLYLIIGIFGYIITVFIGFYLSYVFNDNRMNSLVPWSQPFSYLDSIKLLQKLILSFMLLIGPFSLGTIIFTVVIIILEILILYIKFNKFIMLFSFKPNIFSLFYESSIISVSILSIIYSQIKNINNIPLIIFSILSIIIFSFLFYFIYCLVYENSISINSERKILYFRKQCENIFKLEKGYSKLGFSSEVSKIFIHFKSCCNATCKCKKYIEILKKHSQNSISNEEKQIFRDFLIDSLNNEIKENPRDINIRILYSHIQILCYTNYAKSFFELEIADERARDLQTKISIALHRKLIEDEINSKKLLSSNDSLDVLKISNYEVKYSKLINDIKEGGLKCFYFWDNLLSMHLNVNNLVNLSNFISKKYVDITEKTNKLLDKYPNHEGLLRTYSKFLKCVLSNNFESNEYMNKAQEAYKKNKIISNNNNEESKFGIYSDSISFIISGNGSNLGMILNVKNNVQNYLEYCPNDLIGQNISIIMPPFFSKKHSEYMKTFFNDGKSLLLNKETLFFVFDKNHFINLILLYIKTIPSLKHGLRFIGFMKIQKTTEHIFKVPPEYVGKKAAVLVTDLNGFLLGYNKKASKEFGLFPSLLLDDSKGVKTNSFTLYSISEEIFRPENRSDLLAKGLEITINLNASIKKYSIDHEFNEISDNIPINCESIITYVMAIEKKYKNVTLLIFGFFIKEKIILTPNNFELKNSKEFKKHITYSSHENDPKIEKGIEIKFDIDPNIEMMSVTNTVSSSAQSNTFARAFNEFKKSLSTRKMPKSLMYLQNIIIGLIIILITLSIIDLVLKAYTTNDAYQFNSIISISSFILNMLPRMGYNIISFLLIANKQEIPSFNDVSDMYNDIKNSILDDLVEIGKFNTQMHDFFIVDYISLSNGNITVYDTNQDFDSLVYNIAYQDSLTKIETFLFTLINSSKDEIASDFFYLKIGALDNANYKLTENDRESFFAIENLKGSISEQCHILTKSYFQLAEDSLRKSKTNILIVFICSMIFSLIGIILIIPFIIIVKKNIQVVLSIYSLIPYDLAKDTIINLACYLNEIAPENSDKLKNYLFKNLNENKENNKSEIIVEQNKEENENDLLDSKEITSKEKKLIGHKKELNNIKTDKAQIIICILIILILFITYFLICFLITIKDISSINNAISDLIPLSSRFEEISYLIFYLKYLMLKRSLNIQVSSEFMKSQFEFIKQENLQIQFEQSPSESLSQVASMIQSLENDQFCKFCCEFDENCSKLENGLMKSGLTNILLTVYSEILKSYADFKKIIDSGNYNATNVQEILNRHELLYAQTINTHYLNRAEKIIFDKINSDVESYTTSIKVREIVKFSIFVFVLVFLLFIFWRIFMRGLMEDIINSRGILNLLPAEFITENQEIRGKIQSIIEF